VPLGDDFDGTIGDFDAAITTTCARRMSGRARLLQEDLGSEGIFMEPF